MIDLTLLTVLGQSALTVFQNAALEILLKLMTIIGALIGFMYILRLIRQIDRITRGTGKGTYEYDHPVKGKDY